MATDKVLKITKIKTVSFDACDHKAMKEVFKVSFSEQWDKSFPFPKDPTFLAYHGDKLVGFCQVHDVAPYNFSTGKGVYLYNLCVAPKERKHGIATALIDHIKLRYKRIHAHMLVKDIYHEWFQKRGFVRGNLWRTTYQEYSFDKEVKLESKKDTTVADNSVVNSDENIVYCD